MKGSVMTRKRNRPETLKVVPLPPNTDTIWLCGHDVVRLIAEYLDHE